MKKWKFLLFVLLISGISNAQNSKMYMPLDIRQAYENGTRSYDGKPGPGYWTNHADYKIEVEFDPESRQVYGSETITYFNNSPDSLYEIYLRIYQDFFKKGGARDWAIAESDLHDGVDITLLKVNGKNIELDGVDQFWRRSGTNLIVELLEPILPQTSASLEIEWNFVISKKSNVRMGSYDASSFFVAYWYPQIAVYDDIDGWDTYNYGGLQEFYNDRNNFDVQVKVPDEFVVWATGTLQNAKKVLEKKYYKRYSAALKSDDIEHIIDETDLRKGDIVKGNRGKSWHFIAEQVPDFAFATSDHYLWDLTSLVVDDQTGRRVAVGAAYKEQSKDFYEVAEIGRKTVDFLSRELPGVPFPYPQVTVFNGRGGMEFPMMVNDGSCSSRSGAVHLTSHEISHTYFPFFVGTNERKYAWMDEGWAVMLPFEFQNRMAPDYDPVTKNVNYYVRVAGSEMDIPLMVPTIIYSANAFRPAYRNAAYNRSGMAYQVLADMLGKQDFRLAIQEFIHRWKGKHPIPYDFFYSFENVLDRDLSWFWKPWFYESGYPDLAIHDLFADNGEQIIVIKKIGSLPVPVALTVYFANGTQQKISKTADVWKNGNMGMTLKISAKKEVQRIELGNSHIPDADESNNVFIPTKTTAADPPSLNTASDEN